MTPKESIKARMLALTERPSQELLDEFSALPYRDMMDITDALVNRLSEQCEDFCEAMVDANLPTHASSKAETDEIMARFRSPKTNQG